MSVRDKQLLKRKMNKEHNSNFRAGYVQVNEDRLHRTGIRGRKQCLVFCFVVLLLFVALANLLLTLGLLYMLRIDHRGMRDLELVPGAKLTRFLGDLHVEQVHLVQNKIQSSEEGIQIGSTEGYPVVLKVNDESGTTLTADADGISMQHMDEFVVINPDSGEFVFTTDFQHFRFPEELETFQTKKLKTNHVVSYERDLFLVAEGAQGDSGDVVVSAEKDVHVKGRDIGVSTDSDIHFSSGEGSLNLVSAKGVVLKSFLDLLQNQSVLVSPAPPAAESSKLCVCQENGVLYRIPPPYSCNQANADSHPCRG